MEASSGNPGSDQVWIIGGGTVYREAMPLADTASVTRIHSDMEGDTYAPSLGPDGN
ncbi:dihydrofolate reductase [Arthrobacter sp. NPDC093125]|uniref:dihydrofolate reductase n=1 Tax=Arthrobacter sp. NPDC093125 TaxID=3363944 RepID=UPI00381E1947